MNKDFKLKQLSRIVLYTILFATVIFAGQEEELIKVIQKQIETANRGDLKGYMETIDISNPGYQQARDMMSALFTNYKFKFVLESAKIRKCKNGFAIVRTSIITKMLSGPTRGQNNRTITDSELKLISGKWKLTGSKLVKMEAI